MSTEIAIPDVERVALTLLVRSGPYHQDLRAWIDQIVADPAYQERLDTDLFTGLLGQSRTPRWHPAYAIEVGEGARRSPLFWRYIDEAITRLAYAVVQFRQAGRPADDQVHEVMGMGEPLALVITSLAAAIVEYHEGTVNTWADALAGET